jgi:G3E family GTPase
VTRAGPGTANRDAAASGATDPAVPLTLLTGFLGAGKTTLVNRVLEGGLGIPVGVLVNDFGAVDIDRALIAGRSEGVLSLENGCICCSLRGDLVSAVMRLLERPDAPQRILLEASGVADPAAIAGTFLAPAFRRRLRLDGIVCVVDAEQGFSIPAHEALQLRQIGYADLVVINKTDLAGAARVAELRARIRSEFAGARMFDTVRCAVPADLLFSPSEPRGRGARDVPQENHAERFDSWSLETGAAFSRDALHELARQLPPAIYRAKGIVRLRGRGNRPDQHGVLQIVGRRTDLWLHGPWRADDDPSRLAFIGAAGALDADALERLVLACRAQDESGD